MKKIAFILTIIPLPFIVFSQETKNSGIVTYETVRKLEFKLQNNEDSELASMLPKERKSKKELVFNREQSLYRNPLKENTDNEVVNESAGGANITIKMVEPEDFVFMDMKNKTKTELREFMGRKFLIDSSTDTVKWKITGNQKEIIGYNCLEAELAGAKDRTLAWFAPTLSFGAGPDGFTGLPGLILAMDIDNGKKSITALNIDFKEIDPKEIAKPKGGKKVTDEEFNQIVEEKNKEMNSSGGGMIMIKVEEN